LQLDTCAGVICVADVQGGTAGAQQPTAGLGHRALEPAAEFASALARSAAYRWCRLTPEVLQQRGIGLQQALATLRQCLPPDAVLVGQGIGQDVQWLQLHEGRDFQVAAAAGL
jgi:predicted NBD/HSP70 family sugar kinase